MKLEPADRDPAKLRKTGLILAAIMMVGGVVVIMDYLPTLKRQSESGRPSIVTRLRKNFAAVTHDKKTVGLGELEGKVWLVTSVCLSQKDKTEENMKALKALGDDFKEQDDVRFVVFTVDPEVDLPEKMAEFAGELGLADDPQWWFLAAGEERTRSYLRSQLKLGATGMKKLEEGGEVLMFPTVICIVDQNMHVRGGQFDFAMALAIQEDAKKMLVEDPDRAAELGAEKQQEAVQLLQDKLKERVEYLLKENLEG